MKSVTYHSGKFPPKNSDIDWARLIPLIGPANAAIARYDGLLNVIPNPNVLLSPLTMQEAVLSSRIEGTQATLGEVLEYEAEKRDTVENAHQADIQEVLNYRAAIYQGVELLKEMPLSGRFVRELHKILMRGVRGRNKAPGTFRKIPNWIGTPGCSIEEARFVPCAADEVERAIARWEHYLHDDSPDRLVQLAVVHAEFEAIHPFLDGNGRLGRLLIPLFLYEKKILNHPDFYISEYLEEHRDEYYRHLLAVSKDGNWTDWIVFFLRAVTEQASRNQFKAQQIVALYNRRKDWIASETRSQYAIKALDWFFSTPIFQSTDFIVNAEIPEPTAKRILRVVKDSGLLKELRPAKGRRAAIYAFSELLNIAEGHHAF